MFVQPKKLLKEWILGSPFEPMAKRVHTALFHPHSAKLPADSSLLESLSDAYDRQTRAVMSRVMTESANGVDVGAHQGTILKEMVGFAPLGQHFAFEPIPDCYEQLKERFPTVSVYKLALSDKAAETSFQLVTTRPEYSGLKRRRYDRPQETVVEIKVQTDLLDSIVPAGVHIDFIKIDVEGAEFEVLRGAVKTIARSKPAIVFEHGLGAADYYGTTPEMIAELLQGFGLKISLMECWLSGKRSLSKEEFAEQFYSGSNFYFLAHP